MRVGESHALARDAIHVRRGDLAHGVVRLGVAVSELVVVGKGGPEEIKSVPGVFRRNVTDLGRECRALPKLGVPAVALFPKLDPKLKDDERTQALNEDALVLRAVRAVKKALPELTVVT